MDEKYLWKTFGQILSAMQECHRREGGAIMHRDLKPANIFLDKHGEPLHSCPAPPHHPVRLHVGQRRSPRLRFPLVGAGI